MRPLARLPDAGPRGGNVRAGRLIARRDSPLVGGPGGPPVVARRMGSNAAARRRPFRKGLPEIEGVYQLHRNLKATDAENTDPDRIANDGRKKESGNGVVVRVAPDAKAYTVTVGKKTFDHKTRGR